VLFTVCLTNTRFPQVIQAIPNAIGALCLNEAGQAQLSKRPSIIPAILAIFTSERHLKVLIDKENAVIIGTAVDELIRHHPSLKSSVFDAIRSTLSNIEDLGMSFVCPTDVKQFYQLMPITGSAGDLLLDDDITMQDDVRETIEAPEENVQENAQEPLLEADEDTDEDDIAAKNHDNTVVSFIDILGRVGGFDFT
jgi:E3 ubiquitin-protein ligase HUWE1